MVKECKIAIEAVQEESARENTYKKKKKRKKVKKKVTPGLEPGMCAYYLRCLTN
jgi:hypothetical protein